ncbi:hypothetical protein Q5424_25480 [Conexibacter sp. JD483]|uniref:hypothetical protein n=1 Tax=unclassified Conexibacter TaxID=2627773 RepID=UPI00271D4ADE|nr:MULTISPECIES: hypothetical protein [unclassified Conexibacter]MDO8189403.1 hypothetical protein [Conexibacter sp. CPCC 205706]MDO8202012.1 hypothetical protein [Conexibacter sp. CPCC 205762]MDR9372475.1 hypothetical protein [Conexibacter sp. JD483]
MAPVRIASREVEVDGELTIELLAGGVVRAELRWTELPPHRGEAVGWTLHAPAGEAAPPREPAPPARDAAPPAPTPWPWNPDAERELAQLLDALRDHMRERTARNEMRVRFWERRARDASAVGAAAWGRERLSEHPAA